MSSGELAIPQPDDATVSSAAPEGTPPVAPVQPSLRSRAMTSSMWTLVGYVGAQGLRLGSNLILTRLLFPEAFGLMALVAVFMQGIEMFSDIGILPSIVQNERGEEPRFLNTAWTIQVFRGFALWLCACIGAAPFAAIMDKPELIWLIPAAGITAVFAGFNSTTVPLLNRRLRLREITYWEVASQFVTIVVMIAWALIWPSVWALVIGGLAGSFFRCVSSHLLVRDHKCWFAWERESARELFHFGRWIFISTLMTFFAFQLDKIMLGKLLTTAELGVYSIAITFATLGLQMAKKIGGRVIFPALSEIHRDRPETLYAKFRQSRLALIGIGVAVLVPMSLAAPLGIDILYDDRYLAAGWMLQYLAAGAIVGVVSHSAQHVFLAVGSPAQIVVLLASHIALLITAALLGHHYYGTRGLVIAVAAIELLNYPMLAILLHRHRLWQPEVDAPFIALALGVAALGCWIW